MIHARQPEYYVAINTSNDAGESTVFIEFMLSAIKASLVDAISTSDGPSDESVDKATMRWKQIEEFLKTHPFIMNADIRAICVYLPPLQTAFLLKGLQKVNSLNTIKVAIGYIS